ncbi:MAG: hypothetical protein Q7T11_02045 [Deltaproteobacteria bacterium]|nr:hypothetical protein [Deltaproteobacteria bacterium]
MADLPIIVRLIGDLALADPGYLDLALRARHESPETDPVLAADLQEAFEGVERDARLVPFHAKARLASQALTALIPSDGPWGQTTRSARRFAKLWPTGWLTGQNELFRDLGPHVVLHEERYERRDKRGAAIRYFNENLPLLVEKGLFTETECGFIVRALFLYFETEMREALSFFKNHLAYLLEKGIFTGEHLSIVFRRMAQPVYDEKTLTIAYAFLSDHLPDLARSGLMTKEDWRLIAAQTVGPFGLESSLDFLDRHLPLLLDEGNYASGRNCEALVYQLTRERNRTDDKFLAKHLPRLAQKAPRVLGLVARQRGELFISLVPALKAQGILTEASFSTILDEFYPAYSERKEASRQVFSVLGKSPEWLTSPMRWKSFLSLMYDGYQKREHLESTSHALLQTGEELSPEDVAHLVGFLDLADHEHLARLASLIDAETSEETDPLLRLLDKVIRHFGVQEDHRTQLALAKVLGKAGRPLLAEWQEEGLGLVFEEHLASVRGTDDFKKRRNRFLHFLEAQGKRHMARVYAGRLEKMIDADFYGRLTGEATSEEKREIDLFFSRHRAAFKASELYGLLIKASQFMKPEGIASLRRLVMGLDRTGKRFVFPRYRELEGVLLPKILARWKEEYSHTPKNLGELSGEEGQKVLKAQVLAQIGDHIEEALQKSDAGAPAEIKGLPRRLDDWTRRYAASSQLDGEFLDDAQEIQSLFDAHYGAIREQYGDLFAGFRTDLNVFLSGMEKGVKMARISEGIVVTGDILKMAKSGSEPVSTCQTLERSGANLEGEPLNRLLHGQFKVANWVIDGMVMARRLIEITVDPMGQEHFLVERLYMRGGFARVKDFRKAIIDYARHLGIHPTRVHFNDEVSLATAPKPLAPGDTIYRDTFKEEGMALDEARRRRRRVDLRIARPCMGLVQGGAGLLTAAARPEKADLSRGARRTGGWRKGIAMFPFRRSFTAAKPAMRPLSLTTR